MWQNPDRHEDMEKFPLKGTSSSASTAAVHSTVPTTYNSVDAQVGNYCLISEANVLPTTFLLFPMSS